MILYIKKYIRIKRYIHILKDMPVKLDITDAERYERMKKASRDWKQKKRLEDPEWLERQREYSRIRLKKIMEAVKKEKEEN